MSKLYMLVGVPGSGKSSWVAHQVWADKCAYISTDCYVEAYAKAQGKTYNEVFDYIMPTCIDYMIQDVVNARNRGLDIIWDQTSTTIASRKRKFKMLPTYEATAVVFPTPEISVLMKRLNDRQGKTIPMNVVNDMIKNWQEPSMSEGFKDIMYIKSSLFYN